MVNVKFILKFILVLLLCFVMADTGKRALSDEGFIERIDPDAKKLLEKFGLLKLKDAHGLLNLHQSADKFLKEYLLQQSEFVKKVLTAIKSHDVNKLKTLTNGINKSTEAYLKQIRQYPIQVNNIAQLKGYVVHTANNLKVAGFILLFLLLILTYFLYRRGKYVKKPGKGPVSHVKYLAGVYVSNNLHSDFRYHSTDNPFKIGSERAQEAKVSFERSKMDDSIEIDPGDEVQVCFLVLGESHFQLQLPGSVAIKGEVEKDHFYLGLKDIRLKESGKYPIQLNTATKDYQANIIVK